jgi:hypothetical protein
MRGRVDCAARGWAGGQGGTAPDPTRAQTGTARHRRGLRAGPVRAVAVAGKLAGVGAAGQLAQSGAQPSHILKAFTGRHAPSAARRWAGPRRPAAARSVAVRRRHRAGPPRHGPSAARAGPGRGLTRAGAAGLRPDWSGPAPVWRGRPTHAITYPGMANTKNIKKVTNPAKQQSSTNQTPSQYFGLSICTNTYVH